MQQSNNNHISGSNSTTTNEGTNIEFRDLSMVV